MQEKSSAFYRTLVFIHTEPGPARRHLQWQGSGLRPRGTPNSHWHQDVHPIHAVASVGTRMFACSRPGSFLTCTGFTPVWSCVWLTPVWGRGSLGHVWNKPTKNDQRGWQERGCWRTVWEHGLRGWITSCFYSIIVSVKSKNVRYLHQM